MMIIENDVTADDLEQYFKVISAIRACDHLFSVIICRCEGKDGQRQHEIDCLKWLNSLNTRYNA